MSREPDGEVLLSAAGLSKHYGPVHAVRGVDFELPRNSFVTILGPSGCGKTTILRMIGGFEAVTGGSLAIDGRSIVGVLPSERPVNTVFQNYALFPHLTVFDNVAFGLRLRRTSKDEVENRVGEALATVRMEALAGRYPSQLSGGQQQRVALARAFVNQPRLLLLDEPLGALDLKMRRQMQVELKDLQRRLGMTFLYVTHDQEEAFALSDWIIVMNDGLIEQQGTAADIYYRPDNAFVADFIGGANLIPGRVTKSHDGEAEVTTVLGTITGSAVAGLAPGEAASACIRSEQAMIDGNGDGPAKLLEGRVRHVIFQGGTRLVEVEVGPDRMTLTARVADARQVEPGEQVTIALPRRHTRIVAQTLVSEPAGAAT